MRSASAALKSSAVLGSGTALIVRLKLSAPMVPVVFANEGGWTERAKPKAICDPLLKLGWTPGVIAPVEKLNAFHAVVKLTPFCDIVSHTPAITGP